jgi:hypothetical protein
MKMALLPMLLVAVLAGCQATPYQPAAARDGFGEVEFEANIWRIRFMHNAFTTRETAQSYWLYRASELAISKGYDGFEVLALGGRARAAGDGLSSSSSFVIEGDIRMLKQPFESIPPKTYNAAALKAVLDPYVAGAKREPTVAMRIEMPPQPAPNSEGLKLRMTYSIPCSEPGASQADCERAPAARAGQPTGAPRERSGPAPVVAQPKVPPVGAESRLKPTGPCEVKPVMTDQDLVNCGARVR